MHEQLHIGGYNYPSQRSVMTKGVIAVALFCQYTLKLKALITSQIRAFTSVHGSEREHLQLLAAFQDVSVRFEAILGGTDQALIEHLITLFCPATFEKRGDNNPHYVIYPSKSPGGFYRSVLHKRNPLLNNC